MIALLDDDGVEAHLLLRWLLRLSSVFLSLPSPSYSSPLARCVVNVNFFLNAFEKNRYERRKCTLSSLGYLSWNAMNHENKSTRSIIMTGPIACQQPSMLRDEKVQVLVGRYDETRFDKYSFSHQWWRQLKIENRKNREQRLMIIKSIRVQRWVIEKE